MTALGRFLPVAILSPDRQLIGESGHWDASSKSHVYDIRERPLTARSGPSTKAVARNHFLQLRLGARLPRMRFQRISIFSGVQL